MTKSIRSTAGHVLSTGSATDEEAKSLAAFALQDDPQPRTSKTLPELRRLAQVIEGREGQNERLAMIRAEIARMEGGR